MRDRWGGGGGNHGNSRSENNEMARQFRLSYKDQFDKKDQAQVIKEVLAADLQLVDLTVVEEELLRAPANSYAGGKYCRHILSFALHIYSPFIPPPNQVYGKFCKLDWTLRKKDPSAGMYPRYCNQEVCHQYEYERLQFSPALRHSMLNAVPMFRHLVEQSQDCGSHLYTLNLKQVADLARHQDQVNGATSTSAQVPKVLNFTIATFHESRCGSTLVANAVAAMDPIKHRSYSEAQPPSAALNSVCGHNFSRCSRGQAAQVLRDTLYLMSRSNDPLEERVFFKFQSATTKNLKVFQEAFPTHPWMLVYRDPVQVVMSHIKDDPLLQGKANCMRSRSNPPPELRKVAAQFGVTDPRTQLSMEEYCALHLAAITESAVASLNDLSIPVNYESLPDILYTTILPKIMGRPLTAQEVQNIQSISQNYSKGVGSKHREFKGDSQAKEKAASPQVKAAAAKFLQPSFERLAAHRPQILEA